MDHNNLSFGFEDGDPRKPDYTGACRCDWRIAVAFVVILWTLFVVVITVIVLQNYHFQSRRISATSVPTCSHHGVFQQDTLSCECFQCAHGDSCQFLSDPAACQLLDTQSSDIHLLEEYWNNQTILRGYSLSGFPLAMNYRVPTQDSILLAPPGRTDFFSNRTASRNLDARLASGIRALHGIHRNANVTGKYLVYANGAEQLWPAIYQALAFRAQRRASPQLPLLVFEEAPFQRVHFHMLGERHALLNPSLAMVRNMSSNDETVDSRTIQVVTFPQELSVSNRQGFNHFTRDASNASVHARVYDLTYNWPHFCAEPRLVDESVMVFDLHGLSGHQATRFAWALFDDAELAYSARAFVQSSTGGVSVTTRARCLEIVEGFSQGDGWQTTEDIREIMSTRWDQIEAFLAQQQRFLGLSPRLSHHLQLQCLAPRDANCTQVFDEAGVRVVNGIYSGLTMDHVVLNLMEWSYPFQILLEKLYSLSHQ